jgi:putative oxidoreductase
MKDIIDLLGRLFIAALFLFLALDKSVDKTATLHLMDKYGFTWNPGFLYHAALFALGIGALLVAFGYRVGIGTILICIYWLPYTFAVYDFWNTNAAKAHYDQMLFMRNIAIVGGLFILSANGAGRYSIKRLLATTRV